MGGGGLTASSIHVAHHPCMGVLSMVKKEVSAFRLEDILLSKGFRNLSVHARLLYVFMSLKRDGNDAKFKYLYREIREDTGFSLNKISNSIKQLVAGGFIECEQRGFERNRNVYQLSDNCLKQGEYSNQKKEAIVETPLVGYIYVIRSEELYKIGKTKSPTNRIDNYRTENPYPIELLILAKIVDYNRIEEQMLELVYSKQHHGEWFTLSPRDISLFEELILQNGGMFVDLE
jgi:hypothetical protein